MDLELAIHFEVFSLMISHECGFELIYRGFLSEYPLLEPKSVFISALLVYLRVLITVYAVDSKFSQHLCVLKSLFLVKSEYRDFLCEKFIYEGWGSQRFLKGI